MTTLLDMVLELETWVQFSKEEKENASKSRITSDNHAGFRELVLEWCNGQWDENPNGLANEIMSLV
jgi:hypothetical protein